MRFKPKNFKQTAEPRYDRNEWIKAEKLRVIDDQGNNLGVITKSEALALAKERELDLVLISPNQEIPVAKIVGWTKFKYEQNKKQKSSKGKVVKNKEWQFKPTTQKHDIELKLEKIEKALKKGINVRIIVRYANRIGYNEMQEKMKEIIELSSGFSEPASETTKEGRNIGVLLKLKKKNEKQTQNA